MACDWWPIHGDSGLLTPVVLTSMVLTTVLATLLGCLIVFGLSLILISFVGIFLGQWLSPRQLADAEVKGLGACVKICCLLTLRGLMRCAVAVNWFDLPLKPYWNWRNSIRTMKYRHECIQQCELILMYSYINKFDKSADYIHDENWSSIVYYTTWRKLQKWLIY